MGLILLILLRLFVPLVILKRPLLGAFLAILLDTNDGHIVDFLGAGAFENIFNSHYQQIDKLLDLYYFSLEFFVSLRWSEMLQRNVSKFLFAWRGAGMIAFEITGIRAIFLFAPNIFENFFIFELLRKRFFPKYELTYENIFPILALLTIPKFAQEYVVHIRNGVPYGEFKEYLFEHFRKL